MMKLEAKDQRDFQALRGAPARDMAAGDDATASPRVTASNSTVKTGAWGAGEATALPQHEERILVRKPRACGLPAHPRARSSP